jgi:small subunit ribosomal protein S1
VVFVNVMTEMQELIAKSLRDFKEGSIVKGRVLEIRPREVLVDIGYKSEGVIPASEFDDMNDVEVGDEVEVLLEKLENEDGMVVLSKEKAAHKQNWDKIVKVFEGDGLIKGKVSRSQRRLNRKYRRRSVSSWVAD